MAQVTWSGDCSNGIMVIGESPWLDEVRLRKPFAGASGALLDGQLRRAGLSRDATMVTNVLWDKPPYLGWVGKHPDSFVALAENRHNWEALVERVKPKVIVALGAVAMRQVLGVDTLDEHQAYIHDSRYGVPVVPTYHPSAILQGKRALIQCLFFALLRAKEVAAQGSWQRQPTRYLIDPSYEEARGYLLGSGDYGNSGVLREEEALASSEHDNVNVGGSSSVLAYATRPLPFTPRIPLLVVDIETPNSGKLDEDSRDDDPSYHIIRVSLSVEPATALTLPWQPPYIGLVQEALAAAAVTVVWNGGFDLPRLEAAGGCINGETHDAMWAWHWLQSDMLKSLGFVSPFYTDMPAWKHLSEADPAYYSACDADATMRNYLGIRRDLEGQQRWLGYVRHCLRIDEVLRRPGVGRVHINSAAQEPLKVRLAAEKAAGLAELQTQVPDAVRPRKLRKIKPKADDVREWQTLQEECLCRRVGEEVKG